MEEAWRFGRTQLGSQSLGDRQAPGGVARVNGELAVSRGFGDAEFKKTGAEGGGESLYACGNCQLNWNQALRNLSSTDCIVFVRSLA